MEPPQDVEITEATEDGFTVGWRPPADADGLVGYHVYVRSYLQDPDDPLITATSKSYQPWPYNDDTTRDEPVCVTAVYENGTEDTVESEQVCTVAQRPDQAPDQEPTGEPGGEPTGEPGGAPPARSPGDERTTSQSPAGPSTEPTREETP